MAVAKVEELTRQLEDVRLDKDSVSKAAGQNAARLELDKLKKELMVSSIVTSFHITRSICYVYNILQIFREIKF